MAIEQPESNLVIFFVVGWIAAMCGCITAWSILGIIKDRPKISQPPAMLGPQEFIPKERHDQPGRIKAVKSGPVPVDPPMPKVPTTLAEIMERAEKERKRSRKM